MAKAFNGLQSSQVTKHREHIAHTLQGIHGLTVVEQVGLTDYELWCDKGAKMAEGLNAVGIPARHSGGMQVLIFSAEYPFYAQHRVAINGVAKEIIRIAIECQEDDE